MNDRIEKLAQGCFEYIEGTLDGDIVEFDYKKFAEQIVKECIEQASIGNGHGNNQWDRALTFAAKNIKEHFGVEE